MKSLNISGWKQYMPALGFLAAVYSVYSTKAAGFGQLWTDLTNIVNNPSAFFTKLKANIQYVIAAIIILMMTPKIAAKVSNRYAKMAISLAGTYAGSYLILKYIIDPPEYGGMTMSVAPQNKAWSTGYSALNRGTPVMGAVQNTFGNGTRKY